MKKLTVLSMIVLCLLVTACQSSLPKEAKEALDKAVGTSNYSIVSSQKATKPNLYSSDGYDEFWCIVIDHPVRLGDWEETHFDVTREQLLWSARMARSYFGTEEEEWLRRGCDNW